MPLIVLFLLVVFILIVLFTRIKIVPQSNIYVVERLGKFYAAWETGVHFLCPFLDRVAKRVSIKEQVVDFKPQPVITKDNVTMQIDTVVFFQITNPVQFAYGVERPLAAIENLTATTLRNIIGELEFDATLNSRDLINTKITETIDHATDRWGIKVIRVELKNIDPPVDIKNAMEKQMKAEREKREKILRAEGEKEYQIKVAQGEQEAKVLRAEADKKAAILHAEAEKEAIEEQKNNHIDAFIVLPAPGTDTKEMLTKECSDVPVILVVEDLYTEDAEATSKFSHQITMRWENILADR